MYKESDLVNLKEEGLIEDPFTKIARVLVIADEFCLEDAEPGKGNRVKLASSNEKVASAAIMDSYIQGFFSAMGVGEDEDTMNLKIASEALGASLAEDFLKDFIRAIR